MRLKGKDHANPQNPFLLGRYIITIKLQGITSAISLPVTVLAGSFIAGWMIGKAIEAIAKIIAIIGGLGSNFTPYPNVPKIEES